VESDLFLEAKCKLWLDDFIELPKKFEAKKPNSFNSIETALVLAETLEEYLNKFKIIVREIK
jgi:hypothetical protein